MTEPLTARLRHEALLPGLNRGTRGLLDEAAQVIKAMDEEIKKLRSCPECDGVGGWSNRTEYGTGFEDDKCSACDGDGTMETCFQTLRTQVTKSVGASRRRRCCTKATVARCLTGMVSALLLTLREENHMWLVAFSLNIDTDESDDALSAVLDRVYLDLLGAAHIGSPVMVAAIGSNRVRFTMTCVAQKRDAAIESASGALRSAFHANDAVTAGWEDQLNLALERSEITITPTWMEYDGGAAFACDVDDTPFAKPDKVTPLYRLLPVESAEVSPIPKKSGKK